MIFTTPPDKDCYLIAPGLFYLSTPPLVKGRLANKFLIKFVFYKFFKNFNYSNFKNFSKFLNNTFQNINKFTYFKNFSYNFYSKLSFR